MPTPYSATTPLVQEDAWIATTAERIRAAAQMGTTLDVRGSGSRADFGGVVVGAPLSTEGYAGVVSYDPADLVITARTGTPLDQIDAVLEANGQMLAFEPPRRTGSTLGGAVALGWSGPRRPFSGALRDHLLGIRLLDGRGRDLRFGGQVVKNVAGFDVARLLGGSMGILGMLLEVSLRVIPRPRVERSRILSMPMEQGLAWIQKLPTGPGLLSGAALFDGRLVVRACGSERGVENFLPDVGGDWMEDHESQAFWRALTDQTHKFYDPRPGLNLWRLSVRSDARHPWPDDRSAVDWAGSVRWIWAEPEIASELTRWAIDNGGHATLWAHAKAAERSESMVRAMSPALVRIHHAVADVFDPFRVFNRTRLLPEAAGACDAH
jgi:glycolate oxidase FAD binding subunit